MRERAVFFRRPDMYETQEMCERAFEHSWTWEYVSDKNKTKK